MASIVAGPASAYPFERALRRGDEGRDVRALQVRVAGWDPGSSSQSSFALDGRFGAATRNALEAFQGHYGIRVTGIARASTFEVLDQLQDDNGSTTHFKFSEFDQNYNSACSAQANAYASTFSGGMVSERRTKRNVRRLMWRLEALRAKGGDSTVGINSGYRSLAYNRCIGGASASQHLYGAAADQRMASISNRRQRNLAKGAQFSGIGCYSTSTHNHLDIRLDNFDLESSRHWWWPDRDALGRDLDESGRPCWGESGSTAAQSGSMTMSLLDAISAGRSGAGSLVPTAEEIAVFQDAGEPARLNGAD